MSKNPVITALDVSERAAMRELIKKLAPFGGLFKIGLEMFVGFGPEIVKEVLDLGGRVMLDLKLHDIPNTVKAAAKNAGKLGCDLLTIHASGGGAMIAAAKEGVLESGGTTKILAVTVLTSIDQNVLQQELGCSRPVEAQVAALATLAKANGADGVVCSPKEIATVRAAIKEDFLIVTPGIRPAGSALNDQKRVMTPAEALTLGANYLVIGRPITKAPDPAAAMASIQQEIAPCLK